MNAVFFKSGIHQIFYLSYENAVSFAYFNTFTVVYTKCASL